MKAETVDNNSHQDYMPGVVEPRHDGGKNTVLCVWAGTWFGRPSAEDVLVNTGFSNLRRKMSGCRDNRTGGFQRF